MYTQDIELTGYLSIDKPWLRYYSEEAINAKNSSVVSTSIFGRIGCCIKEVHLERQRKHI